MTNKEWLEEVKKNDENIVAENFYNNCEYRQAKALEIIAEEMTKLNETVSELKKVDMLVKYGQEETRPESGYFPNQEVGLDFEEQRAKEYHEDKIRRLEKEAND